MQDNSAPQQGVELVPVRMSGVSIAVLANNCLETFATLCLLIPSSSYFELNNLFDDEFGRFQVWAGNIGALRDPSSAGSLEARLQTSELMRRSVESGLGRAYGIMKRAASIILGDEVNRAHGFQVSSEEELVKKTINAIVRYLDSNETKAGDEDALQTTELAELFLNIRSCITHLFTLSMRIRRDRPRGRIQPSDHQSLSIESGPDITNAKDKFPKLKQTPWLAERMGNWIAERREYIRYRQSHRKKLGERHMTAADSQSLYSGQATTRATSFQRNSTSLQDSFDRISNDFTNNSITSTATSFATTAPLGTGSGRRVPELTDLWLDGIHLQYDTHIECPYCRTIQRFDDRFQWKRHVYGDLQLYACTFENCSVKPFPSSHEWFKHEMNCHRRLWICSLCKAKCPSASALEEHCISSHAKSVSSSQRKVMIQAGERAQSHFDRGSCPFCDKWMPGSSEAKRSSRFRSHLEKHLQELAREAIPLSIDGLNIKYTESDEESEVENDEEDVIKEPWQHIQISRTVIGDISQWICLGPREDSRHLCSMLFATIHAVEEHFISSHSRHKDAYHTYECECGNFSREPTCNTCGADGATGTGRLFSTVLLGGYLDLDFVAAQPERVKSLEGDEEAQWRLKSAIRAETAARLASEKKAAKEAILKSTEEQTVSKAEADAARENNEATETIAVDEHGSHVLDSESISSIEKKYLDALKYQDDIGGPSVPLTAETLRRARLRTPSSGSSTRSGNSDDSNYKRTNTTAFTQSSNDQDYTIKVSGSSVVRIGDAEIQCEDGEITFGKGVPRFSNDRANTIYQLEDTRGSVGRRALPRRPRSNSQSDSQDRGYEPTHAPYY